MTIATPEEIKYLRQAGRVVALTLRTMEQALQPGITKADLDAIGAEFLARHGAKSAPKLVYDFPGTTCISINEEIVHGVPNNRVIHPGDLVTIDVTIELDGYIADAAITVPMPPVSRKAERLCACAKSALQKGLRYAQAGRPINRVSRAIEREVKRHGFTVIPQLTGHGLGKTIHEEPTVPNFYHPKFKQPFEDGMVVAIEPIICAGASRIVTDADDDWTIKTADGRLSAHFEHTVIVTPTQPIIITQLEEES